MKERSKATSLQLNTSSEDYFVGAYQDVMYGGLVGFYSRYVHRAMERRYRSMNFPMVLELGAGQGQHRPFVAHGFTEYVETDIDLELLSSSSDSRVHHKALDAQDLSGIADSSINRLIATCLLAHLDHMDNALKEWCRVVKPGGALTILVPTEPGIAVRLARHLIVTRRSRKFGQDHLSIVYKDHRNHYPGMRTHILEEFRRDKISKRRFPIRWAGWNLNLFELYFIEKCD